MQPNNALHLTPVAALSSLCRPLSQVSFAVGPLGIILICHGGKRLEQQFTATKAEIGELDFNIFSVYLSDLDEDAKEYHFLGFQRALPNPDDEENEEDDGFYVEYNGQENGRYQRTSEQTNVTLIELSDTALQVSYTPAADVYQGVIDTTSDVPLSQLVINFNFTAEQVSSLREALQPVVGQDTQFRYTGAG